MHTSRNHGHAEGSDTIRHGEEGRRPFSGEPCGDGGGDSGQGDPMRTFNANDRDFGPVRRKSLGWPSVILIAQGGTQPSTFVDVSVSYVSKYVCTCQTYFLLFFNH